MNTTARTKNFTRILDTRGNIGEILIRPQQVVKNPLLRNYHYGQWLLFIGPKSICRLMTSIIVGLAEHELVRVLDCGSQYDPKLATRLIKEKTGVFEHILLKQAHNCAQALYILDHTSISPAPFIGLDLLKPFEAESIDLEKRKDMLKGCMQNLRRLQLSTGGMVSLSYPTRGTDEQAGELYRLLEQEAKSTFDVVITYPGGEMGGGFF